MNMNKIPCHNNIPPTTIPHHLSMVWENFSKIEKKRPKYTSDINVLINKPVNGALTTNPYTSPIPEYTAAKNIGL
jgi:hypothetical protein